MTSGATTTTALDAHIHHLMAVVDIAARHQVLLEHVVGAWGELDHAERIEIGDRWPELVRVLLEAEDAL